MIVVAVSVKDGPHTRGEVLELDEDDLGPAELARVEELMHEMSSYLERLARLKRARAQGRAG